MKIYSIIGSNVEHIDQRSHPVCPDGFIEMTGRRPDEHHIASEDGTWREDGSALDRAKAAKLAEINAACDGILNAAVYDYPASEVQTFSQQTVEAQAYLADPATIPPLLSVLAQMRGITLDELAEKVMAKHEIFSLLAGCVIGQRQALEDRLEKCRTAADVMAIDVTVSLPEMG
ncbi:MAG: hypothetical protein GX776_01075, partial [Oxalobacter sp.]|nr:hypothetical protein [Oxalobacter sp.]